MTDFAIRSGVTGYCTTYDPIGVEELTKGRIRLTATKTRSAGLMGPIIEKPCRIEVEVTGALHALHPLAVFAVWTFDDATENELDLVETTRWGAGIGGDRNNPNLYYLTSYEGGTKVKQASFPSRAFNRHKIVADLRADGTASVWIYGWWSGNPKEPWKEVAQFSAKWKPGQLRIALWTHLGIKGALGPCSVVLERVDIRAAIVT